MTDLKQNVNKELFENDKYIALPVEAKAWIMQVEFSDEQSLKARMDERINVYNQSKSYIKLDSISNDIVKQLENSIVNQVIAAREVKNNKIIKEGMSKVEKINEQINQGKANVSKSLRRFMACGLATVIGSGCLVKVYSHVNSIETALAATVPGVILAALTLSQVNNAIKSYNEIIEKGAPVRAGLQQIFPIQTSIIEAGGPKERRPNPSGIEKFSAIMSMMPKIKALSDYFEKTK